MHTENFTTGHQLIPLRSGVATIIPQGATVAPKLRPHDALSATIAQVALSRCRPDDTPRELSKRWHAATSDVISRMSESELRGAFDALSPRQQHLVIINGAVYHFALLAHARAQLLDEPVFSDGIANGDDN